MRREGDRWEYPPFSMIKGMEHMSNHSIREE